MDFKHKKITIMKEKLKIYELLFIVLMFVNSGKSQVDENRNIHYFHEIDTLFANPNKGYMSSAWLPDVEPKFPNSVAYRRFNWSDLEPQYNTFNWIMIDSLLTKYKAKNLKLAFGIMTASPQAKVSSTPLWVFEKGCKNYDYVSGGAGTYQGGKPITRKEPDYSDPVYLSEHSKFLEALAKRYDGNSGIEIIDIGSYGEWGEWHTTHPASLDVRKKIIDMYVQNFKKTKLLMLAGDYEALPYALSKGTGWRRDGLGSLWDIESCKNTQNYPPALMEEAWKNEPIAFEWYGDYPYMKNSTHCSFEEGLKFAIASHCTYLRDNGIPDSITNKTDKFRKIGMMLGYNFVINEIVNSRYVIAGRKVHFILNISNIGIAPMYKKHILSYSLIDTSGTVILTLNSKVNVKSLIPGIYTIEDELDIPGNIIPGYYRIGFSFINAETGIADIKLPINAFEKNCIYELSEVIVK